MTKYSSVPQNLFLPPCAILSYFGTTHTVVYDQSNHPGLNHCIKPGVPGERACPMATVFIQAWWREDKHATISNEGQTWSLERQVSILHTLWWLWAWDRQSMWVLWLPSWCSYTHWKSRAPRNDRNRLFQEWCVPQGIPWVGIWEEASLFLQASLICNLYVLAHASKTVPPFRRVDTGLNIHLQSECVCCTCYLQQPTV